MITGKTQIKEVLYMDKGIVQVICGDGVGKTSMALGKGIGAITKNKRVIMIQFLKGALSPESSDCLLYTSPSPRD